MPKDVFKSKEIITSDAEFVEFFLKWAFHTSAQSNNLKPFWPETDGTPKYRLT